MDGKKKLTREEEVLAELEDDRLYARYAIAASHLRHILPLSQAGDGDYVFIKVDKESFKYLFPYQDVDDIFLNEKKRIPVKAKFAVIEATLVKGGREYNIPVGN